MENPPLWVWAIIVGAIIAGKFIYRWQATKQFTKEQERTKEFTNNDSYANIDRRHSTNIRAHKYSPKSYYKDYFTVKKKRRE